MDLADAQCYPRIKPAKHAAEMAMIRRGAALLADCHRVLDAPCGAGRVAIELGAAGFALTGLDLSARAVTVAREQAEAAGSAAGFLLADIEHMPFANRAFDATLCFRLYHHFADEALRTRVIAELCRVSGRYVLISYLSPFAVTSIRRALAARLGGRRPKRHANSLASIERKFAPHGFVLVADIPRRRFVHTLHLAVFRRIP
jgi:SAM-dependent methyltransferase